MKKITLTLLCFVILNVWSCKKNEVTAVATIADTGDLAFDGCDWLVKIDSVAYHPDNLDDKYKVDKSQVRVTYKITNARYHCGIDASQPGFQVIHIIKISTVN